MDRVAQQRIVWTLATTDPVNEAARSLESEAYVAIGRLAEACGVTRKQAAEWIAESMVTDERTGTNEKV